MNDKDIHKTTFITPFGQYEWLKMGFGYKNFPSIFQRAIFNILRKNNLDKFTLNYMDDIIIHSHTIEEHIKHVALVLEEIEKETINPHCLCVHIIHTVLVDIYAYYS